MKTRWIQAFGILLVLGFILAACGAQESYEAPAPMATPAPAEEKMNRQSDSAVDYDEAAGVADGSFAQPEDDTVERMVIHTANISIIVDDVEQTLPQVLDMVRSMEGYIVYSSAYRTYTDRLAATVTLRVPADRFDEALTQLRAMSYKVTREDLSGEDVTDQYVDLQSRLKTLQTTEQELLALLSEVRQSEGTAEEKANAILSIYEHLTGIRSEIEQIQGRMQYLEQMAAMATITVELTPLEPDIEQPVVDEGFDPGRIFRRAARDLVDILQGLAEWLIRFVMVTLPVLAIFGLLIVLPIWLIVRWLRRRRQRSQ